MLLPRARGHASKLTSSFLAFAPGTTLPTCGIAFDLGTGRHRRAMSAALIPLQFAPAVSIHGKPLLEAGSQPLQGSRSEGGLALFFIPFAKGCSALAVSAAFSVSAGVSCTVLYCIRCAMRRP